MRVDMCEEMVIDMGVDMPVDMCTGIGISMRISMCRHGNRHVYGHADIVQVCI